MEQWESLVQLFAWDICNLLVGSEASSISYLMNDSKIDFEKIISGCTDYPGLLTQSNY